MTLRALREARRLGSLPPCLTQEYRIALSLAWEHDFREGVRAAVIDKDRAPRWNPATLAEVTDELVARHFLPPPTGDLGLSA